MTFDESSPPLSDEASACHTAPQLCFTCYGHSDLISPFQDFFGLTEAEGGGSPLMLAGSALESLERVTPLLCRFKRSAMFLYIFLTIFIPATTW